MVEIQSNQKDDIKHHCFFFILNLLPCIQEVAKSYIGDSIACAEAECDKNEHEDGGVAWQALGEHPVQETQGDFSGLGVVGNRNLSVL